MHYQDKNRLQNSILATREIKAVVWNLSFCLQVCWCCLALRQLIKDDCATKFTIMILLVIIHRFIPITFGRNGMNTVKKRLL